MKDKKAVVKRKLKRVIGGLLLVTLACLVGTASRDASAAPNRRAKYMVLGTIENIDNASRTITVKLADGTDRTLQLPKRLTVNGHQETREAAESALVAQERAVVYYADNGVDQSAYDVESVNHAMRKTVTGTLISADKDRKVVVLRTNQGKEETFRVQNDAVIETGDAVMIFAQFEPQSGTQITLHYEDPLGMSEVSRIRH
jgi:hypothetical protein